MSPNFPRINKTYPVESSITERITLDVLPVNLAVNLVLQDRYLELRIPGNNGMMVDLSTLAVELNISFTNAQGTDLTEAELLA